MVNRYSLSNERGRSPLGAILKVIFQFIGIIIGILIAFQIQNWNSERDAMMSKVQHLQALQADAQENFKRIDDIEGNRERQVVLLEALIAAAANNVSDDTIRLAIDELLQQDFYSPTSSAYMNLIASGDLNITVPDSIRAILSNINQLQAKTLLMDAADANFIAEQLEPYLTKRQVIYLLELKTSNNRADLTIANQQTGRIIKSLLQDRTFIDLIYLRMNRINETIEASTLILTQLERLTNELAFELARIEEEQHLLSNWLPFWFYNSRKILSLRPL